MRLAALKTGFGVPHRDFNGGVHAVFKNALMVAVADAGPVTLVPADTGALPGGISLDMGEAIGFDRAIAIGARAAARAGILRVAGGLTVDLRQAVAWRSGLDELVLDMDHVASRAAFGIAAALLSADGRVDRFLCIAAGPVAALVAATRKRKAPEAGAIAEKLVGLGEGGTPAGDDFLVGFMAALHAGAGRDASKAAFVAAFGRHLRANAHRTNDVSRVYLEAAVAGEVSEKLTRLAARIAEGGTPEEVAEVTGIAIAVGHTSGADGTLGLLAGMAAWGLEALLSTMGRLAAGRSLLSIA
jgi:hypothetical protein